jgi:ABC-type transport system substrate-binding protein
LLSHPAASVLQNQNVERWGFDWSQWRSPSLSESQPYTFDELPVGTGPFRVDYFDFFDNVIVLKPNLHYWRGPPQLERIEFVSYDHDDYVDTIGLLRRRQTDFTFALGPSNTSNGMTQNSRYGIVQSDPFRIETGFLVFNTAIPPFDNLHFRNALAISALCSIQSWFAMQDQAPIFSMTPMGSYSYTLSNGIIPPDNPAYDNERVVRIPDCSRANQELRNFDYNREVVYKWDRS